MKKLFYHVVNFHSSLALGLLSMALVSLSMVSLIDSASGAEWGTFKGQLIYDGDPITAAPIKVTKDEEVCGKHNIVDETIKVGKDGGLANVFVYLYVKRGKKIAIHADYGNGLDDPAILDNIGCRFEPHAMCLYTKQKLEIRNSDTGIGHNTNAQALFKNPRFNEQITNASTLTKKFDKSESNPAQIACNIHPWMNAYLLIRDNPYMAVTGEDGTFEIKDIPAGAHEFTFWHEIPGYLKGLSAGGDKISRKGRLKVQVPAGDTLDLGAIKVAASLLEK